MRFNQKDSLFARLIKDIQEEIAASLECAGSICTSTELLAREWGGSKPILDILPEIYFPGGSVNLLDLDFEGRFNQVDPRYWKMMGEKLSDEVAFGLVSDGDQSLLVLLNLMKYMFKAQKEGDTFSKKLVQYVQKVVIDSYFTDYLQTNSVE